jgi:hypothetical protein
MIVVSPMVMVVPILPWTMRAIVLGCSVEGLGCEEAPVATIAVESIHRPGVTSREVRAAAMGGILVESGVVYSS